MKALLCHRQFNAILCLLPLRSTMTMHQLDTLRGQEPAKVELIAFRAGGEIPGRRAFCILQSPPLQTVIETVIDLSSGSKPSVAEWKTVSYCTRPKLRSSSSILSSSCGFCWICVLRSSHVPRLDLYLILQGCYSVVRMAGGGGALLGLAGRLRGRGADLQGQCRGESPIATRSVPVLLCIGSASESSSRFPVAAGPLVKAWLLLERLLCNGRAQCAAHWTPV